MSMSDEDTALAEAPPFQDGAAVAPPSPEPEPTPVRQTHLGVDYLALLSSVHRHLQPQSYLEIGTHTGDSLRLARCASIAIDPKFKITSDVIGDKPQLHLYQMTSDAFFRGDHVRAHFPEGIDLAFLDGMHLFEYLLRDFINIEKHAHWRSIVVLHDCLPPNIEIAERDYRPHLRKDEMWRIYWTGDVWKLIPILKRYRPDLKLTLFDAPPSGLTMVTGLDPGNRVLEDNYAAILAEFRGLEFDVASYREFYRSLDITPSAGLLNGMALSAFV